MVLKSSQTGDIKPEDGVILGRALAMDKRRVAVARDLMRSSTMMAEAVISGLLSQGASVVDLGEVSAPAAAFAADRTDCTVYVVGREGMMSGYYLLNPDGSMFTESQIRHLDLVYVNPPPAPDHTGLGNYSRMIGVTAEYNNWVMEQFSGEIGCSVILDCRCGITSESVPQILNKLGADVLAFNTHRDSDYRPFSKGADEDGTDILEELVAQSPGSIGIRMNGTGTAMEVIAENGEPIPMDIVFAMIVMYLRPGSIAIPSDSPSAIIDAFEGRIDADITPSRNEADEHRLIITDDSASAVCDAVSEGAEIGFYHGSIVFGNGPALGDGIVAATLVTRIAGENSIHRILESFPEYYREEKTFECEMKVDAFKHAMEENLGGLADRCTRYDNGFRFVMDEGWFLIRHFTRLEEYNIGIVAESKDRAYIIGMMEVAGDIVREILRNE